MNNIGNTRIKKFVSIVAAVSVLTASSAGAAEIGEGISENAAYFNNAEISENAAPSENSADFEGDPASERDPDAVTGEDGIYEDGSECQSEGCGYIPMDWDNEVNMTDEDISFDEALDRIVRKDRKVAIDKVTSYDPRADIPAKYPADTLEGIESALGGYPEVKNQGKFGSCWAHSSIALGEFYKKNHGETGDIDYSEMYLAYGIYKEMSNSVVSDAPGAGIEQKKNDMALLDAGGALRFSSQFLSKGFGFINERDDFAYISEKTDARFDESGNLPQYASALGTLKNDAVGHLSNMYEVDIKNRPNIVKEAIMRNGIVGISYYHNSTYYYSGGNAYYNYVDNSSNHAVCVVGWDDTFNDFNPARKPSGSGAWLVRNSWGNSSNPFFSYNKYFWISYEDLSMRPTAYIFELTDDSSPGYDYNYYYDTQIHGTSSIYSSGYPDMYWQVANVFTVPSGRKEVLREVTIETGQNTDYEIRIFKNPNEYTGGILNPMSGTEETEAKVSGTLAFSGIYTIPLGKDVSLTGGDRFSIAVKTKHATVDFEKDFTPPENEYTVTCKAEYGQSYYINGSWIDMASEGKGNFCIAAHTLDAGSVLKASDFNITLPDSRVYKGTPYSATVVPKAGVNSGAITIYYGDPSGSWSTTPPTDAGTYRVKIDTAGSVDYNPGKGITDDTWKFTIAKAPQTAVTLNGDKEKTYGDPDFTVTASGGNGTGAFVYSSSDEAVLSVGTGGRVTVNGVGTAEITVYRAESKNYRKSGSASIMITVKKADQTLNPKDMTVKYGGGTFELVQPGGQSSGKCVYKTDSKDILVIMDQTGTAVAKKPGRAVVTVYREGDDNYNRSADASFDVNVEKGVITISADDITVLQDKTMPELTYTAEGMAGWDALTREPVLTCEAADTSVPGTYDINASGAEVGKPEYYEDIRYIKGTLTVIEDKNKRYEEVIFKDLSGGGTTLIHDKESNTYRTADGRDVVVVSNEKGEDAGNPAYQYTGKKITPGRNSSVVYNGIIYNYGTDYKASYKKNKKRGTTTLTIKWQKTSAPYLEGVKKTIKVFDILPRSVSENMVSLTIRKGKIKKIMVFAEGFDIKATKKDYSCSGSPLEGFTISFKNNFEGTVLMKENYQ